jgi:hypothetical protein
MSLPQFTKILKNEINTRDNISNGINYESSDSELRDSTLEVVSKVRISHMGFGLHFLSFDYLKTSTTLKFISNDNELNGLRMNL